MLFGMSDSKCNIARLSHVIVVLKIVCSWNQSMAIVCERGVRLLVQEPQWPMSDHIQPLAAHISDYSLKLRQTAPTPPPAMF